MDKITNNFFHSQTNSTTELGHSPPFLDLSRKLLVNGFLIMIKYIYNQIYYLQESWILLGGCLMEHLGRNETNYFMYQWAAPRFSLSPCILIALVAPASQSSLCIALHQLPDLRSFQFALTWPQGCA